MWWEGVRKGFWAFGSSGLLSKKKNKIKCEKAQTSFRDSILLYTLASCIADIADAQNQMERSKCRTEQG